MEYADAEPAGSASSLEFFCLRFFGNPPFDRDHFLLAYRSYFREACSGCSRRRR